MARGAIAGRLACGWQAVPATLVPGLGGPSQSIRMKQEGPWGCLRKCLICKCRSTWGPIMATSSTPTSSLAPDLLESSAREAFFGPLAGLAESSPHARSCPGLPDAAWLRLGIARTLHSPRSGRGFLQTFAPHLADCPDTSHFFEILKSPRRAALVADVAARLARQVPELEPGVPVDWPTMSCTPATATGTMPPRTTPPSTSGAGRSDIFTA